MEIVQAIADRLVVGLVALGAIIMAVRGLEAAKVNVSPEAIQAMGDALARNLQTNIVEWQEEAELTPTPYDDIASRLAGIPADALISYMRGKGYLSDGAAVAENVRQEG